MKYCRIISLVMGIILLAAALMISPAEAKTKKYKPMKFADIVSDQDSMKFPAAIGATDTSPVVSFTAPVRLPAGTEVTGLDMWCSLEAGGLAFLTLRYIDPSEIPPIPHVIYGAATTDPTADTFTPVKVEGVLQPAADRVIRKGRLYYLQADLDPEGFLWRADLSYQR